MAIEDSDNDSVADRQPSINLLAVDLPRIGSDADVISDI
jgi:hypothetical protein